MVVSASESGALCHGVAAVTHGACPRPAVAWISLLTRRREEVSRRRACALCLQVRADGLSRSALALAASGERQPDDLRLPCKVHADRPGCVRLVTTSGPLRGDWRSCGDCALAAAATIAAAALSEQVAPLERRTLAGALRWVGDHQASYSISSARPGGPTWLNLRLPEPIGLGAVDVVVTAAGDPPVSDLRPEAINDQLAAAFAKAIDEFERRIDFADEQLELGLPF